jgi:hypothetical protein
MCCDRGILNSRQGRKLDRLNRDRLRGRHNGVMITVMKQIPSQCTATQNRESQGKRESKSSQPWDVWGHGGQPQPLDPVLEVDFRLHVQNRIAVGHGPSDERRVAQRLSDEYSTILYLTARLVRFAGFYPFLAEIVTLTSVVKRAQRENQ